MTLASFPKVVAVMRAVDPDLAISRAEELIDLGCRAVEITLDTPDFERVLRSVVRAAIGRDCLVGVGSIMDVADVSVAAKLGATFAVSPIHPKGFVDACLRHGLVAGPAAFTPTEIWSAHAAGAHFVKVFPASAWSISDFKGVLCAGELRNVRAMPSGGITIESGQQWLRAGAACVGMGSSLCGKDVRIPKDDPRRAAAEEEWRAYGRQRAKVAFETFM